MSNFKYISNIRILLYNHFYSNQTVINSIINSIVERFDLFSINYNECNHSIELKIKKTNIRKNPSFSHTSTYYYTIFNSIFHNILYSNKNMLENIVSEYKETYCLDGNEVDFILQLDNISMLLNITTLSDNIVIIYL